MKRLFTIAALIAVCSLCEAESLEFHMSVPDKYRVSDTEKWSVSVLRVLDLRFADVKVVPKGKKTFSLMLYFKCDTPDLAEFNTPRKMKRAVVESSKIYLGHIVEKEIVVEPITNKGWYGFRTKITDASLAGAKPIPEGEFLYIIRGMIRLSKDSALGFSLMTNDPDSAETREIEEYIYSFATERP
jgi:hypothetical protein